MGGQARVVAALIVGLGVAGCSDDMGDLRQQLDEIKARPGGAIEPLPEFVPYESFTYDDSDLRDPFIPARAFAEAQEEQEAGDSGIAPDPDRTREPLERFPLDSLDMVGTLRRGEQLWGLVRTPDGAVHQVLEGNYIGQNHGRITAIHNDSIQLIEIVRDGTDDWMEQEASLGLGEEG